VGPISDDTQKEEKGGRGGPKKGENAKGITHTKARRRRKENIGGGEKSEEMTTTGCAKKLKKKW